MARLEIRVRLQAKNEKKERKALRKVESKMMSQKARAFIQRLFATKQRAANKMIKGNSSYQKITALRDQKGEICSDPEDLKQIVTDYFQDLAKPLHGSRNGLYVPDDVQREYPWEKSNLDPYRITTRVHIAEEKGLCTLELLKDKLRFLKRIRSLARNKAPGKDGIPNEILMNLPEELVTAIHDLFVLRYMTGSTPASSKQSRTVLLYKKEDPLDIKKYRPIALADTLTKLYTGLLTDCMTDYAEHNDILSTSQEGFRRAKGTARQLLMMQNVLSDAKLFGEDIYLMYVDFSSAFNTIDHDKLLIITDNWPQPPQNLANALKNMQSVMRDCKASTGLYIQ